MTKFLTPLGVCGAVFAASFALALPAAAKHALSTTPSASPATGGSFIEVALNAESMRKLRDRILAEETAPQPQAQLL